MTQVNEQREVLAATVEKLFVDLMQEHASSAGVGSDGNAFPATLWQQVEESGIASVMVPESAGGFGGGWEDAFVVLYWTGFHAVPLPIAETILAQSLLHQLKMEAPTGPLAIACLGDSRLERNSAGEWKLDAGAVAVPWGNAVGHLVAACEHESAYRVMLVETAGMSVVGNDRTVAREPIADLTFKCARVQAAGVTAENPFDLGALTRVALMAGALNAALQLSVQHAGERRQFGKPIGRFQAVQQALALMANEAAAVSCAALAACRAADRGEADFEIAAAKLRANRAVDTATSIAHQVHGAIGFTAEYRLHSLTQRLWSWRSQYGNDRYWASRLGAMVARRGAEQLWPHLTSLSDRISSRAST